VKTSCADSGLRQQPLIALPAGAPAAVNGRRSRRAPARAPLTASSRGGYQRYIRTLNLTVSFADLNWLSEQVPPFTHYHTGPGRQSAS
jgi:hypothetical protein